MRPIFCATRYNASTRISAAVLICTACPVNEPTIFQKRERQIAPASNSYTCCGSRWPTARSDCRYCGGTTGLALRMIIVLMLVGSRASHFGVHMTHTRSQQQDRSTRSSRKAKGVDRSLIASYSAGATCSCETSSIDQSRDLFDWVPSLILVVAGDPEAVWTRGCPKCCATNCTTQRTTR